MKLKIALMGFVTLAQITIAQVKTDFNNPTPIRENGKFLKSFPLRVHHTIQARDTKALLDQEISENRSGLLKPYKIAESIIVNIDVIKEADWILEAGFAYGKFTVVAKEAKTISANFDNFYLPPGTEMWVYNENGEMITGPITQIENNENNTWGTWFYKGQKLTIDFKLPAERKEQMRLHISGIAYGYKDLYVAHFGESAACNVNVICPIGNGWENERNSVCLILNGNSTILFSGSLINNSCNLDIPYLLTANHAFIDDGNVANWKFTFQAWSPVCDQAQQQNANGVTFNGSILRSNSAASDFCLVQLNQTPAPNSGITYAGWSRNVVAAQNTVAIHHPEGDVMKIATDANAPITVSWMGGANNHWRAHFQQGTVEPGSSGSPLFDQNHHIVGQLHGNQNTQGLFCDEQIGEYGKFDVSWVGGGTNDTRLSNWLDPGNTGAITVNTRGIPSITSSTSQICSNAQFTLTNPPGGTTWQSSNTNGLTIDMNTGYATSVSGYNGLVTVSAVNACGAVATEDIWVGLPSADINTLIYANGHYGEDPVTLSSSSLYRFGCDPVSGDVTSFTWVLPSGFSFAGGSTTSSPRINTSATVGSYSLFCSANNVCGAAWTHDLGITIEDGGCIPPCQGPASLSVYPTQHQIT